MCDQHLCYLIILYVMSILVFSTCMLSELPWGAKVQNLIVFLLTVCIEIVLL